MTVENFILPDLLKHMRIFNGEVENFKVLQHSARSNRENIRTFLTHHSIVYVVSGTLHLMNNGSELSVQEGEMCLIAPGAYFSSELIGNQNYSMLGLFFNQWTAQYILKLPGITGILNEQQKLASCQEVHIIPKEKVFRSFFDSIHLYRKLEKEVKNEMIPIKFAELIYILLEGPHKQTILSFLSDAAMHNKKKP